MRTVEHRNIEIASQREEMVARTSAVAVLVGSVLVAACGQSGSSGPPRTSQPSGGPGYKTWDLRMPLAKPSGDGKSLLIAYQTFVRTRPIDEVLIRETPDRVGITVRGGIPTGALVAVAWGFACAQAPLKQPIGDRRIIDDSRHKYPGIRVRHQQRASQDRRPATLRRRTLPASAGFTREVHLAQIGRSCAKPLSGVIPQHRVYVPGL